MGRSVYLQQHSAPLSLRRPLLHVQNHLHLDPRDANANNNASTNANTNWNGGDRPSRLARLFRRDHPLRAALNLICLLCGGLVFGSMSSVPALQSSLGTGSNLSSTQTAVYFWLGVVVVAVVVWHLWYACAHFSRGPHLRVYLLSRGAVFSFFAIQVCRSRSIVYYQYEETERHPNTQDPGSRRAVPPACARKHSAVRLPLTLTQQLTFSPPSPTSSQTLPHLAH